MERLHSILYGIIVFSLIIFLPFTSHAAVTLSNATTQLVVNGGEANNGLVPYDGYFRYTDIGQSEETTWSIDPVLVFSDSSTVVLSNGLAGGFGSPTDMGGGIVRSLATVNRLGLTISVQADTQLIGTNARTTFTFTSDGPLDGTTFLFYAENDLFGAGDDEAAFTGSIAGNNLVLYQYDSAAQGMTVRMTGEAGTNSTLSLFGAGIWTGWGTALEGGNLSVLSSNGSNFATVGDLGLALAFTLSGTTATVTINYDTQPAPPAQQSVSGTISYTGAGTGSISVAAFDGNGCGDGNYTETWIPAPGPYTLALSPGTYYICACRDTNGNGTCPDANEPSSEYALNPVVVAAGAALTGINISLQGQLAPTEVVPTMTEWGMIMLIVLMGMSSIYFLKRRRTI